MCRHTIFLTNDFVIHKSFVALHVVHTEYKNGELPKYVLDKLNTLLADQGDFSVQCLTTSSETWESVVQYDRYFESMFCIEYKGEEEINDFVNIIKANKVLTAKDIAKFVLSKVECTQLKLQKLVYFCYADYLAKTGKAIISEEPVPYTYGPLFESLWKEYKKYHNSPIPADTSQRRQNIVLSRYYAADSKLKVYSSFADTINKYGQYSASQLVELTHRENSPWSIARNFGMPTIDAETIKAKHKIEEV